MGVRRIVLLGRWHYMGGHKRIPLMYQPRKEAHGHKLNHFLDFGPDPVVKKEANLDATANERLKRLVKQLEDLNKRVDKLTQTY